MTGKSPDDASGGHRRKSIARRAQDEFDFLHVDPQVARIELAEVKLWPPRQGERGQTFPIWPELRIAEETITTKCWRVSVHLIRAELSMSFTNCEIALGTRYADDPRSPTVKINSTDVGERNQNWSGQISPNLSGIRIQRGTRSKATTKQKSELTHRRMSTLTNDRWEIAEPNGRRLRGPFLVAPAADDVTEEPLCRINANADAIEIALSLEVRPGDIDPDIVPLEGPEWLARTRETKPNNTIIAKLLVVRACTDRFGRSGDERVIVARAILQGKRRTTSSGSSDDTSQ